MSDLSLTLTIGRNVSPRFFGVAPDSPQPLSDAQWGSFQAQCRDLLHEAVNQSGGYPVFDETHLGLGVWDGVTEESAKIAVLVSDADAGADVDARVLNFLRPRVRRLADTWFQDAIAIQVGRSELA